MRKSSKLSVVFLALACAVMLCACDKNDKKVELSTSGGISTETVVVSKKDVFKSSVSEADKPEPSEVKYSVEDVVEILGRGYTPPYYCVLDHVDEDGNYVIHLYESVDNGDEAHSATVDWITVNPATGDAENFFGEKFNIESVLENSNDSKGAEVKTGDEMFDDFLNGRATAKVAEGVCLGYDDYKAEYAGQELSFAQLYHLMSTSEDFDDVLEPVVSYSVLNRGENFLWLWFRGVGIEGPTDEYSSSYFVIAKRNGGLEFTYNVDTWSRSDEYISASGIINGSGSSGAGDHVMHEGFIDASGEYREIYFGEDCCRGWIGSLFSYFKPGFFSEETIRLADEMDWENNYEEAIVLYSVGDSLYGVFYTDENSADAEALKASALKDGLAIAPADHMTWIIEEYALSLGLTEGDIAAELMKWTDFCG